MPLRYEAAWGSSTGSSDCRRSDPQHGKAPDQCASTFGSELEEASGSTKWYTNWLLTEEQGSLSCTVALMRKPKKLVFVQVTRKGVKSPGTAFLEASASYQGRL